VKKSIALLAIVLSTSLAYANSPKAPKAAAKTHVVSAEVVSADASAKTLTVKDEKGQTETVPVLGKAVGGLGSLKAGERVSLTCQDNAKGEHTGIIAIKPAKPAAPKSK